MSTPETAVPGSPVSTGVKFGDMSIGGKLVFMGKFVIFLCSFGFIFPTLLND